MRIHFVVDNLIIENKVFVIIIFSLFSYTLNSILSLSLFLHQYEGDMVISLSLYVGQMIEKHENVRMCLEMYEIRGLSPTLCVSHMSHGENVSQYDLHI